MNLHLLKDYKEKIPFLVNRLEQFSGHEKDEAKISNQPGCIITTSGPGVTDMIALHKMRTDGVPLFLITKCPNKS